MPKISIIVPVYNVEKYLHRCISTLVNQSLKDIEIILVNDGSIDNSGVICDEYAKIDNRIKVIHKQNGGQSSARNEGLRNASADLVGFVDSDDWISLDMYEYLYNLQIKNDASIVACKYAFVFGNVNKENNNKIEEIVFSRDEGLEKYLSVGAYKRINEYSVCNKIYKKQLFEDIFFPEGYLFEDMEINFRLFQKCSRSVFSTKVCYFYFQNNVSSMRNQYSKKHNDLITVVCMIQKYAENENEKIKNITNVLLAKAYFSLLTKVLRYGTHPDVNDFYVDENLLKPFKKEYKLFMKSKFSVVFKILGFCYKNNWELTKKIYWFIKKLCNKNI